MRTTVTLDPDVEQILRDRMSAKGVSFKRALNDAVRDGSRGRLDVSFATTTVVMGAPLVDLDGANRIAADLEDAEIVAKLRDSRR